MAQKRKQYVKLANGTLEQQMLATSADIVEIETIDGITATDVQGALEELKDLADNGGVTGVKGSAESTYRTGQVNITAANIGLGNVSNTSDADKPVSTAQTLAISSAKSGAIQDAKSYTDEQLLNYIKTNTKGVAGGVASLGTDGKVPSSQLPSYVDDAIEGYFYNSKFYKESAHTTQITGESGKIYVDLSTNKTYRWSGSAFVEISASLALGETSSTAYPGDKGAANATAITALQTSDQTIGGVKKFSDVPEFLDGALVASGVPLKFETNPDGGTGYVSLVADDRDSTHTVTLPSKAGTLALNTVATSSQNGLMSALMVSKLEGIATGATANEGTVTSVTIKGGTGISVDSESAITTSGTRTVSLSNSGVTAGTYSVVTVDAKGRATAGTQLIEWGTSGQTTPSNLAVGGLFMELIG